MKYTTELHRFRYVHNDCMYVCIYVCMYVHLCMFVLEWDGFGLVWFGLVWFGLVWFGLG